MRIVHLTSHLNIGGVTSYVLSLSRALAQREHHVTIASDTGQLASEVTGDRLTHWQVPLHTSVEFSPNIFLATQALARRLQSEPPDLLHAHTRVGQVVADRLSKRFRIPFVTTWHGFFRPNLGRTLWPCTGHLTIAISEPVRQHLMTTFHVPAQQIRLIPHGIDPTPFEAPVSPAAQQHLRDQLGLLHNAPVIGTMTRLVASKGVEQLIQALTSVRASVPGTQLLIVGDGEERAHLEQLAASCGLTAAVHVTGALTSPSVALSLMRVFVFLPAEQEGFGLSLLEAMAGGRPIVAIRRGGGAPWVLEEAGVGQLVEPNQPEALAASIVRYLQDEDLSRRAAEHARAVVKERFSLARMVDAVEAVYREPITHHPSLITSR